MATNKVPLKRARQSVKARGHRQDEDRDVTQNREITDSERVDMLKRSLFQASLPDLPKIPGYHVCWLTTQNPRDPIHGRLRLGYTLIKAHEIPEFESLSIRTGDYQGCIGVNEMIAAKLPLHLYEAFMREWHFDSPSQQEESIYNDAMSVAEQAAQAARRGGRLKGPVIDPGTEEMGNTAREPPNFADEDQY